MSEKSNIKRRNVNTWATKAMKKDKSRYERTLNQMTAFRRGKNVVLTIPNPNKTERNKPFIKVNAKDVWNNEKYMIKQS
jgi:hypothetical protein|tara:strand:+ start:666 stop:902 length:237 start_codon:yes stop_codon:yes gene_type:complete